jgi:hypothetical protein
MDCLAANISRGSCEPISQERPNYREFPRIDIDVLGSSTQIPAILPGNRTMPEKKAGLIRVTFDIPLN